MQRNNAQRQLGTSVEHIKLCSLAVKIVSSELMISSQHGELDRLRGTNGYSEVTIRVLLLDPK